MKRIYFDSDNQPFPGDVLAPVSSKEPWPTPTRYYRIHEVREVRRVSRKTPGRRWNLDVTDEPHPVFHDGETIHFMWWYPRGKK